MSLCDILFILALWPSAFALICFNCQGWSGRGYTPRFTTVPTCDYLNNACESVDWCVKIVNPIQKGRHYVTYTSECWNQINLQQTPTNLVNVNDNVCYNYTNGAVPPTIYLYCFCNDRDYCNAESRIGVGPLFSLTICLALFSF